MNNLNELITVLAGFLATAFAILRMTLSQTKGFAERLVSLLEASLAKQDETLVGFRHTVDRLTESVHENTLVIRQVAEWLQVTTPVGGSK